VGLLPGFRVRLSANTEMARRFYWLLQVFQPNKWRLKKEKEAREAAEAAKRAQQQQEAVPSM
jgi:hypothetical protein